MAEDNKENLQELGFNEEGKTRKVEFNLQRPIDGSTTPQDIIVQVPFIGLVLLPNLLIDDVLVDFEMNVTTNQTSTENKEQTLIIVIQTYENFSNRWCSIYRIPH